MVIQYFLKVFISFTLLAVISTFGSCKPQSSKKKLIIPDDKVGLIGYGSLTSKKQMEHQLGREYDGFAEVVHITDYKRTWNMVYPNNDQFPPVGFTIHCVMSGDTIIPEQMVALNIQASQGSKLNAVLFIISEEDVRRIDQTEPGYKRIEITKNIEEYDIEEGPVYAYQALDQYTRSPISNAPDKNVVVQMYLGFLETGFEELGTAYRDTFYKYSEPYDESLVLDCYLGLDE